MPVAKRAATGKLPAESTSFVGRRRLLAEVKAALTGTRLLTLVGPGGVGKTRLALRAAADLARTVRDGVWIIELAGLEDSHPWMIFGPLISALVAGSGPTAGPPQAGRCTFSWVGRPETIA